MSISSDIGNRVKKERLEKGLSQEQFDELVGFHRTYIGMVERGERNISLSNISVFAKAFDMNISELLDFSDIDTGNVFREYENKK